LQQIMASRPEKQHELWQKAGGVGTDTPSIGSGSDSGLGGLKQAVKVLGNRAIDRRTTVGNG